MEEYIVKGGLYVQKGKIEEWLHTPADSFFCYEEQNRIALARPMMERVESPEPPRQFTLPPGSGPVVAAG